MWFLDSAPVLNSYVVSSQRTRVIENMCHIQLVFIRVFFNLKLWGFKTIYNV
jgi:hypothetical protein